MTVTGAPSGIYLRTTPSFHDNTIVVAIPNDSIVTVLDPERDGWIHVRWNWRQGYARAEYLK